LEGKEVNQMTWIDKYANERSKRDPEFKAGYDEEMALLALVRARNEAAMSQKDLAESLNVSQPYIAQVERGTKPMSLSLMMRYAKAVGVTVTVQPAEKAVLAE
jgi:DNA-binding XRE family transcriptional regulator